MIEGISSPFHRCQFQPPKDQAVWVTTAENGNHLMLLDPLHSPLNLCCRTEMGRVRLNTHFKLHLRDHFSLERVDAFNTADILLQQFSYISREVRDCFLFVVISDI